MVEQKNKASCFLPLNLDSEFSDLPKILDYPFYYDPKPIAVIAARKLQTRLENEDFKHNFGIEQTERGGAIGKMFGVLVVENNYREIGYLAAFSGKLGDKNHHEGFVPPIFDILKEDGFFKKGEGELNELNRKIESVENSREFANAIQFLERSKKECEYRINQFKSFLKSEKQKRDEIRLNNNDLLSKDDFEKLNDKLKKESINQQLEFKKLRKLLAEEIVTLEKNTFGKLYELKELRANKSAQLQQAIFNEYTFLNSKKQNKSLLDIFSKSVFKVPPAGAGECAAPKLFQYAFLHDLKPICMAEFWWGMSPDSEVRVHKQFYPACRGKCEPILKHMLDGIQVEDNPMMKQADVKDLEIVFEDDCLLLVNKPTDFLSVPGKELKDSVLERIKIKYPNATGPLLVHRLDMSTSGLLLVAKTDAVYKNLQSQFIQRKVKKTYIAFLDGVVNEKEGIINLPLRVDLEDRPKQMVCYEHGKNALTKFKVIETRDNKTRIEFYPITGRTHQLRVHSAHHLGLNCPIVGDDLYGKKANRLHLHAAEIEFIHPISRKKVIVKCEPEFEINSQ
jgi:tRNA pseudouridine32 synthase/23S rRNA pseudouridine746 synthase